VLYHRKGYSHRSVVAPFRKVTLVLNVMPETPADVGLKSKYFQAVAKSLSERGSSLPFLGFAASRARWMAGAGKGDAGRVRQTRRSEMAQMMSLYTGMTSVEEALQTDRGLLLRGNVEPETIGLADVKAIPIAAHPWDEMMDGKTPIIEPLAMVVPADALYVHFHDLRSAVKMAKEMDQWITPLAQTLEWRAGSSHLISRYETALMVERSGLSESLGHLAVSGVAVVVGDPFLREGTDISIAFKIKNGSLLRSSLLKYEMAARKRHTQVLEASYTVGDSTSGLVEVRNVYTADRQVNQHRAEFGDVLIISNSRVAMERFAAVRAREVISMAESGDFKYMRTIYPFKTTEEDGFVFISDAFVGKTVSPRTRILQARRMTAQADVRAVGNAALMYGWLEGRKATAASDLVAAGYLDKAELKHADGSAIEFDPATGARSTRWSEGTALKPLDEMALTTVTVSENAAYKRFAETYQSYWRSYIDPVAVRLRRSKDGQTISVDARMMPLIDASEYDNLIEMVGKTTVTPPKLAGAVQWTVAVGEDAKLRRELDGLGRMVGKSDLRFGWLGDWAMAGTRSSGALWDLAVLAGEIPQVGGDDTVKHGEAAWAKAFVNAPFYAGAHVKNPLMLAATLTSIRAFVESAAPGLVSWGVPKEYRKVPVVTITGTFPQGDVEIGIRYAVVQQVFLVSPDQATLEALIDDVLDGRSAGVTKDTEAAQAHLNIAPGGAGAWLTRTVLGLIEKESHRQTRSALRAMTILKNGLTELPNADGRRAAGLGYLGFEPDSAQGGKFSIDARGHVNHSLYGSLVEPVVPAVPIVDSPAAAVLGTLKALDMGIAFEGEGRTRGLHVMVELTRTKK
jgi:hypothetical protein